MYGFDIVVVIWVMCDGWVSVFMGMGGNFVLVIFDIVVIEVVLCRCVLIV